MTRLAPDRSEEVRARTDLPSLSVVISCRNGEATLRDTLEALARQEYPGWWEVVLVDNGSTDGTGAVMAEFASRLPHCSVITNSRPGYQAAGVNLGVRHSRGSALLLLDADDVTAAGYLRNMGEALRTEPFVGAFIDVRMLNANGIYPPRAMVNKHGIEPMFGYLPVVIGCAMGLSRAAFDEVGGLDEEQPSQPDVDVSWRLQRAGYRPAYVPGATLHYRFKPSARAAFRQEFNYGLGEALLYRNHREHGMPRRRPISIVASYARVVGALLVAWRPGGTVRLAEHAGKSYGRLRGSIRYGVAYL